MTQEHTPGPWVSNGRYVGVPNHKSMIAECRDKNGDWATDAMSLANARLIAAAPDMLAALKLLHADGKCGDLEKGVRAIIEKATGRK